MTQPEQHEQGSALTPFQIWRSAQEASINGMEQTFWGNLQAGDIPDALLLFALDRNSAHPNVVTVLAERGDTAYAQRFIFPYIRPYSPDILSQSNPHIGGLISEMVSKKGWDKDPVWAALIATHTILDFNAEVMRQAAQAGRISKDKQHTVHSALSVAGMSKVFNVAIYDPFKPDELGKPIIGGTVQYFSLYEKDVDVRIYSVIYELNIAGKVNFTSLFPLALLFLLYARQEQTQTISDQPEKL